MDAIGDAGLPVVKLRRRNCNKNSAMQMVFDWIESDSSEAARAQKFTAFQLSAQAAHSRHEGHPALSLFTNVQEEEADGED